MILLSANAKVVDEMVLIIFGFGCIGDRGNYAAERFSVSLIKNNVIEIVSNLEEK
jgi:hypothetical protein